MTAVHSTGQKGRNTAAGKTLCRARPRCCRCAGGAGHVWASMIEELAQRSNDTFALKAGTLYPILHALEGGRQH